MKKLIAVIMAAAMLLSMAACGAEKKEANVANPWTDAESLDELNEKFGGRLAKPPVMGVSDEHFSYIDNDSSRIAQYNFSLGGYEYTFRFSDNMKDDISGINTGNGTLFEGIVGEANLSTSEVKASRWFTVDGQYVLMVTDNNKMEASQFSDIAEEITVLTVPEEANGDEISAATYVGSYTDSFSQRAVLDVTYDNGVVTGLVSWGSSASEMETWQMTLEYSGEGILYYSDCTHASHIWNEKGEEKYEALAENEEGYFFVNEDGSLAWSGAPDESCASCVFVLDK